MTPMSATAYLGLALAAGATALLLARDEIPQLRAGGANVIAHPPLAPLGKFPVLLDAGRPIVFVGDSNTAGSRVGGSAHSYPAFLTVPRRIGSPIVNKAVGGATAPLFEQTSDTFSQAQLVVVMFGTNDAAPRRYFGGRKPVAMDLFCERMTRLVRDAGSHGATVVILAAPPAGSVAMDERIAPYRAAARVVAEQAGTRFLDPMDALKPTDAAEPVLAYDGIHLTASGQDRLARWLDQRLAVR